MCSPGPLKPMREESWTEDIPVQEAHAPRRTHLVLRAPWPLEVGRYSVHENCLCNVVRSVRNRVVFKVPLLIPEVAQRLMPEVTWMASQVGPTPTLSYDQVLEEFPRHKRRMYRRVLDQVASRAVDDRDSRIKAFVKAEKLLIEEKDPDPRMIQARSPIYNLAVARYLKPMERRLYRIRHKGLRVVAKGLNDRQRAALIAQKMALWPDTVVFSMDVHRWDAHVQWPLLDIEHTFYMMLNGCQELRHLLAQQRENRCSARAEGNRFFRWKVKGSRMSGDMNTALGNCVLCVLVALWALRMLGIDGTVLSDGDDHLVFVPRRYMSRFHLYASSLYRMMGLALKLEPAVSTMEEVEFCQAKPVQTVHGWVMCPNPAKVLATAFMVAVHQPRKARYLQAMWDARAILHAGVPMLGDLFNRLKSGEDHDWEKELGATHGLVYQMKFHGVVRYRHVVDLRALESFQRAWGATPEQVEAVANMPIPPPEPQTWLRMIKDAMLHPTLV